MHMFIHSLSQQNELRVNLNIYIYNLDLSPPKFAVDYKYPQDTIKDNLMKGGEKN